MKEKNCSEWTEVLLFECHSTQLTSILPFLAVTLKQEITNTNRTCDEPRRHKTVKHKVGGKGTQNSGAQR